MKCPKTIYPILLFYWFCNSATAQDIITNKLLEDTHEWHEGSIMTADGTALHGALKFNDKTGLVAYESGSVSETFSAQSVAGFEFFDEASDKQRIFYSFAYNEGSKDVKRFFFFEVLKELKTFAVLSRVDPIEVSDASRGAMPLLSPAGTLMVFGSSSSANEISQTETIYFMSPDGKIDPYVKTIERDVDWVIDYSRTKNRYLDEGLLKVYTQSEYDSLVKFAKDNKLDFSRKNDLIKVLEQYQELTGK